MRIDIMTLFPETCKAVLHESIIGRAVKKGIIEINAVQIRDFTQNKQMQVDDYPYGGGPGCVMMAQPLKSCLESIQSETRGMRSRVIYMSPQGKPYNQDTARRLKNDYDHLVLVCGHYEGIDERFIEECVDEEISLGDFVLTGGEIAAMAVADSVCRLIPGVLSEEACYTGESHWDGLLEYPQYTRPEVWEGRAVPNVLIQGNHQKVEEWRRRKQFERTMEKRPDLFEKFVPGNKEDKAILASVKKNAGRVKLVHPLQERPARPEDLEIIGSIIEDARASLKRYKVDQWQGPYPTLDLLREDISRGICHVICHGDEVAAFFVITFEPEADYEKITDGKWSDDLPYCTVHRSAVAAKYRGTEVAGSILAFAEQHARARGVTRMRGDTHRRNKPMRTLFAEHGFRYRGNVLIESEPGHDPARQCFEKILKGNK